MTIQSWGEPVRCKVAPRQNLEILHLCDKCLELLRIAAGDFPNLLQKATRRTATKREKGESNI